MPELEKISDTIGGPHPCLWRGCGRIVDEGKLVDDEHWLMIPVNLRLAMVDSYSYFGDKSAEYVLAVDVVIDWLNRESGLR